MRLDIRFAGVSANEILLERILDEFEQKLGRRAEAIVSIRLQIGENLENVRTGRVIGKAEIHLKDGSEIRVTTTSAKLMALIELCTEKLDEHFANVPSNLSSGCEIGSAFIPQLPSFT